MRVSEADPVMDSLVPLYGSARYMERECHEMYGIVFRGNADLRPLLLYEGFVGHPLRKDYPKDSANSRWFRTGSHRDRERPRPVRTRSVPPSPRARPKASVIVNIGPSHPATHGTIQIVAELSGERVIRTDVHCGYLHRGFEKECESHTWHNLIPYVDRLNYCSALINNFAYCEAVEKLMEIEITPRCRYLRTLLAEYSRIADHLTCIAAALMELGAMTAFLYLVTIRDYVYEHIAALTGARVTYTLRPHRRSGARPARGLAQAPRRNPRRDGYVRRIACTGSWTAIASSSTACATSACWARAKRSTGVSRARSCVRRACRATCARTRPTSHTAELDFEVPVGIKGDNYDRYYVRMREIDESRHMIRQLIDMLQDGPINVDDRRCTFPEKRLVYTEIESLINHFKLVMEGPQVPAGEVYSAHEGANGELGFYLVSVGGGVPWKVHVRSPSFVHMGGVHRMLDGYQLADIVPTFGSVNMIGGECDR